ncbi:MAG: hypothetical protein DRI84_01235 [Bacteroidetes bacterium]|nr:MAG: hypothetical protein DRI84_01235 [Bacteroidota bacterium]
MKRAIIISIFFIIALTKVVEAQYFPRNLPKYDQKSWHFGFTLGMNSMDFEIHPVDHLNLNDTLMVVEPMASQGFNIGIVSNKRLSAYLDLRFVPTLSFGERSIKYILKDGLGGEETYIKSVESTYIDFPITLKYKSKRLPGRWNNSRVFIMGGVRYSLDLASQKKKKGTSNEVVIKLNPHDLMGTLGVGFDFFLPYFKLGIELQMAYGVLNLMSNEPNIYNTNIDRMTSKMTWITFTFE